MWLEYLTSVTSVIANVTIILSAAWVYLKIKRTMTTIDEIVQAAVAEPPPPETVQVETQSDLRERLIEIAVAGKSREYLGKIITSDEIERLDQKELQKLHARYETYMGGLVTRSLKKHAVTAYTKIVELFLPGNLVIANRDALEDSLNEGPFIDIALSKWTCWLHHRWGYMLGPLELALLTSTHVQRIPHAPELPVPIEPEEVGEAAE